MTSEQKPQQSAKSIYNVRIYEWAHLGSNQGPTGYEPVALPAELWARQLEPSYPARNILSSVDEIFQLATSRGVSQLSQRFGFDLPNPLTGD